MAGVSSTPGPNQADIDRLFDDPALRELRDRGSPALLASTEDGAILWANDAARQLLGDSLSSIPARLTVQGAAAGPSLRLRRILIGAGGAARPLTLLTKTASLPDGAEAFLAVVLGLPDANVLPTPAADPAPEPVFSEQPSQEPQPLGSPQLVTNLASAQELRAEFMKTRRRPTVRFLWQTDENRRVSSVSPPLGEIVGDKSADIVGRDLAEIAATLQLDPSGELLAAISAPETWSGIEAAWPITGAAAAVPVDLGGFPIFDAERIFRGFRGFGVIHLDRIHDAEPLPDLGDVRDASATGAGPESELETPIATPERLASLDRGEDPAIIRSASPVSTAPNVVPLRPYAAGVAGFGLRLPPPEVPEQRLSEREHDAFDEIARTLHEGETGSADLRAAGQEDSAPATGADGQHPPVDDSFALLERLPLALLICREETPLYANRMLLDLSGYGSLEALQAEGGLARLFDGFSPADVQSRAGDFSIRTKQGETLAAEGKLQAISWEGQPASFITLRPSTDGLHSAEAQTLVAELHNREAELSEVRAILESASDGVAILDANGRILSLNHSAETLFGYEQNELAGEPFTMLIAPDSRRIFDEHLEKLRSETPASPVGNGREVAVIAPEGGTIPIVLSLARIGGGERQATFCAVVHNLATSRGAEKAAKDARHEAERASAVKSDFLAKVSHEIRTPLNAIIGFAEVIMDERLGPIGTERYKDYLRDIHRSGTHVMSLVNDLLDLSKIEAGKMALDIKPVDANAIISECVGLMQPQANRERVIMRLALAPRLLHVAADERSLRQIILNLLSNAVKYNEPGGQVIVSTAMTEAGHAVIRIKDTGIGMSDADLAVALEPFRQVATARSVSGTGLGLPLTKALIEANHADFTIRSRKDEGTLVEVTFLPARVLAESA